MTFAQFVIGAALIFGVLIAVACIGVGIFGFTPQRAEAVRAGEAALQAPVVIEEIRHVRIRKPEEFQHGRLDRHPAYLALHLATWCYAWCIFSGSPVTSNVASLNDQTRLTMALCFLVGSSLVLVGSAMGVKLFRWTVVAGIRDNMTSPMLGDDIRLPYMFAVMGLFAVGVSMGIYSSTSFETTVGSLGGWITGWAALMCVVLVPWFIYRIRRYIISRDLLIAEAVANILERGHDVD